MEASSQEINEIKEMLVNPVNLRYRRISMHGSTAHTVVNVSPDKLRPKEIVL